LIISPDYGKFNVCQKICFSKQILHSSAKRPFYIISAGIFEAAAAGLCWGAFSAKAVSG
jgi:hypothetical protein